MDALPLSSPLGTTRDSIKDHMNISTLPTVSNDLLISELRRRITTGWLPSDPSYLADLLQHLEKAQSEVEADVRRQAISIDWNSSEYQTAGAPKQKTTPKCVDRSGSAEIYDWLRGHGYSDDAAASFIKRLPSQ